MSEPLPTPTADTPAEKDATKYVVLILSSDGSHWGIERWVEARSADAAIRTLNGLLADEATLVAVPARSWKPVRVKPKTVTTLVIEDA